MTDNYEIEVKELDDGSGDLCIDLPPELMKKLNWREGDDLRFEAGEKGSIRVRKIKLESVELDFDDEELFKYMLIAHNQGISFNELCENALKDAITKAEFEDECR